MFFVSPQQENLEKIVSIVKRGYLDNISIHFLGYLKDPQGSMSYLADRCGAKASRIKKICQYNLNFVSLGKNLFTTAISLSVE